MRTRINQHLIASLRPGDKHQINDTALSGFNARVSAIGAAVFYFTYRTHEGANGITA